MHVSIKGKFQDWGVKVGYIRPLWGQLYFLFFSRDCGVKIYLIARLGGRKFHHVQDCRGLNFIFKAVGAYMLYIQHGGVVNYYIQHGGVAKYTYYQAIGKARIRAINNLF